jgi:hypothetical protein
MGYFLKRPWCLRRNSPLSLAELTVRCHLHQRSAVGHLPHRVPLEYWVTWPELGLCGMVILIDHARDNGFSPDGSQVV